MALKAGTYGPLGAGRNPTGRSGQASVYRRARTLATSRPASVAVYLIVMYLIYRLCLTGAEAMGYNWQWYRIPDYLFRLTDDGFEWGEIAIGLVKTVELSVLSYVLATLIGLFLAILRLSGLLVGGAVSVAYLEFIRNMPLLVLLYLIYYVIGPIFRLDRYTASVLTLAIYHSALISEIFRAGINAVDRGQWEAARSIGMSTVQCYRYIILPQSVKFMLPPLTGEAVHLIKSSAIVSVIAVAELTTIGRNLISDTYMSFEIWFTVAAVYMVVTLILSVGVTYLENRYAVRT